MGLQSVQRYSPAAAAPLALTTPLGLEDAFSRDTIELVRANAPKGAPDVEQIAPGEDLVTTLNSAPSHPILHLTDLSGNQTALLHALVHRGFVTFGTEGKLHSTPLGLEGEVVLGGDMNDRNPGLIEIILGVNSLRKGGHQVTSLYGNHELLMLASLAEMLPMNIPDYSLKWASSLSGFTGCSPVSMQEQLPVDIEFWMGRNGGAAVVKELASYYRRVTVTNARSMGNGSSIPPLAQDELRVADLIFGHTNQLTDDALDFLHARRCLKLEPIATYLEQLQPIHRDGGLVFVHAFLPKGIAHFSGKRHPIDLLNLHLKKHLSRPFGFYSYGHQFHWTENNSTSCCQRLIPLRAPGQECFNQRLINLPDHRNATAPLTLVETLKRWNVECIVRGHDPVNYLEYAQTKTGGQNSARQLLHSIDDLKILNCDIETKVVPDRRATGYTFFSRNRNVYSHSGSLSCT